MKQLILSAFFLFASGHVATACPWAGKTFTGSLPTEADSIVFTFDADCTSVVMSETNENTRAEPAPLEPVRKGWVARYKGDTKIEFDAKGKRARATRGGLSRSFRLKAR